MIRKRNKDIFLAGASSPDKPPTPMLLPPSSNGAKRSIQKLSVVDLLCEGPIEGIVDKNGNVVSGANLGKGIYLNNSPVVETNGGVNFNAFQADFRKGDLNQSLLGEDFAKPQRVVDINQKLIGTWKWGTGTNENWLSQDHSSEDVRAGGDFGKWRGRIHTGNFPEDEEFKYTHTIENPNVTSALINVSIDALFDTVASGSGQGESGDIGVQTSASIRFRIQWGYFNDSNVKVTTGSRDHVFYALISSSPYGMTFGVNLASSGNKTKKWITVQKLSYETLSPLVSREMSLTRITSVIDSPLLSMPNSVVIGTKYDARVFNQLPQRSFDCKLKIIRVPNNYEPNNRSFGGQVYSGVWDGSFKWAWTDNPAWILYDLICNNTYGVGDFIDHAFVDKWSLYEIGRYCDAVDDDGLFIGVSGVEEPRFSCNMLINQQKQAFDFINSVAAIFRGFTYWMNGGLLFSDDRPKETIMTFSNTDVKEGNFNYSETAKNTRFTIAEVQFNDKDDEFTPKIESVEDADGLSKIGPIIKRVEGMGVTSRSEANRLGKYILYTSRLDKETVSFVATQEVLMMLPGDVFAVSDKTKTIDRVSGKILGVAKDPESGFYQGIQLDAPTPESAKYITLVYPQGSNDYRDVFDALDSFETQEEQVEYIQNFRRTQQITVPFGFFKGGEASSSEDPIAPQKESFSMYGITLNQCGIDVEYVFDPPVKSDGTETGDVDFQFISDMFFEETDIRIDYEGDLTWGMTTSEKFLEDKIGYVEVNYGFYDQENDIVSHSLGELDQILKTGNYSYVFTNDDEKNTTLYRLIGYREVNANEYEVVGLLYNESKFSSVEGDYIETSDFAFSDMVSSIYGINTPNAPDDFTLTVSIQPSIGAFANKRVEQYDFTWTGNLPDIDSFALSTVLPNGEVYDAVVSSLSYSSVAVDTYSYTHIREVEGELEDLEYGSYGSVLLSKAKAPYFTPSTSVSSQFTLEADESLINQNYYSVESVTIVSATEEVAYSRSMDTGSATLQANDGNIELSWTLESPVGVTVDTAEKYFAEQFFPQQKVYILDSFGDKIPASEISPNGLSTFISRSFIETVTGDPDIRDFSILIEVYSSVGVEFFSATIETKNDAPAVTGVVISDANTTTIVPYDFSGEVVLDVSIDNFNGDDLKSVYVFSGPVDPVVPDLVNLTNLMATLVTGSSSTSSSVSLGTSDGQSTTLTANDLPPAYDFDYRDATQQEIVDGKPYPKGYLHYAVVLADSIGFGDVYDSATHGSDLKGIMRLSSDSSLETVDGRVDAIIDELVEFGVKRQVDFTVGKIVETTGIDEIKSTEFSLADIYGFEGVGKDNVYKIGGEIDFMPTDIANADIKGKFYDAGADAIYIVIAATAIPSDTILEGIHAVSPHTSLTTCGVVTKQELYVDGVTPVYYPALPTDADDGDLVLSIGVEVDLDFSVDDIVFGACLMNITGTSPSGTSCQSNFNILFNGKTINENWAGTLTMSPTKDLVVLNSYDAADPNIPVVELSTVRYSSRTHLCAMGEARAADESLIFSSTTITPQDWSDGKVYPNSFTT